MLQGDPGDHRIGQADGLADTVETGTNPAEWERCFRFPAGRGSCYTASAITQRIGHEHRRCSPW